MPRASSSSRDSLSRFLYSKVKLVEPLLVLEGESLVDGAVGDVQVVDVGGVLLLVFLDGEDVDVVQRAVHHLRLRAVAFYQQVFLFHFLCLLEAHFLGEFLHAAVQHAFHGLRVALEYLFHLGDVAQVLLFALLAHAGARAVVDVVLQADAELAAADVLRREAVLARAQGVEVLDEVEHGNHAGEVAVGAEVGGAVAHDFPGAEHAGKRLFRHADAGVGLVVLQQHVVPWLVLLDEVVFQQQGVFLGVDHDVAYVRNLGDEQARLARVVLAVEVAGHAAFQVLRLAHVDDGALGVEVLVDAGAFGQVVHDARQVGVVLEDVHEKEER